PIGVGASAATRTGKREQRRELQNALVENCRGLWRPWRSERKRAGESPRADGPPPAEPASQSTARNLKPELFSVNAKIVIWIRDKSILQIRRKSILGRPTPMLSLSFMCGPPIIFCAHMLCLYSRFLCYGGVCGLC